ncbi:MAG: Ldh family oxidoreductase, partial [Parcubacteria group bacterium]|nr:Ldh family oxidoreductase [Parcubacteria group bacterium]
MTGSGGVFRDVVATGQGAKCIVSTDIFCFANPDMTLSKLPPGCLPPDYLLKRCVHAVRDYGNRVGIPTNNGSFHFHDDFRAKPTVLVGAYGIIPKKLAKKGQPKKGDIAVAIGGRTGRDGIHGATFSSAEMTDRTITVNSTAVQIGNAIEEKRTFDALLEARGAGCIRAMQDCGAGGFSSAFGEMGEQTGITIHLEKALLKYGYTAEESAIIKRVLLYAQMRGNNQGVVKLIGPGIPKAKDAGNIEVEKNTKLSALINGSKNHAMVVVNQAVDTAIQKAKEHGIGIVGVNHINTSSGALGYYAKRIAEANLIGVVFAGSMESVAAFGSYEPIFGTNPMAFGIPRQNGALVLDMATAAMAYFGVIEASTAGRSLPEDIAYDKEGNITVDPAKVLDGGALRTFDKGPKGSGLSMIVQILTGPLIGASFTGIGDVENNWSGHLVLAIDPELLGGLEVLEDGVAKMIERVKATKKLPNVTEIFVPGEKGDQMTKNVLDSGEIEIEENLYNELKKVVE